MLVQILFYAFSLVLLASALGVIALRNPVHSALCLVVTFFSAAAIWLLLEAEFLAIVLVLVYVGAVMVLFLFVVMMLDINVDSLRAGFWKHFPIAATVGVLIALEMAAVLLGGFNEEPRTLPVPAPGSIPLSNTKELGKLLYSEYLYPLEVAAAILLVAIIAAIALTLRKRKDTKQTNPSEQVRVRASDRLRMVKLAPTLADPEPKAAAAENKA